MPVKFGKVREFIGSVKDAITLSSSTATDLEIAFAALQKKQADHCTRFQYYEGFQPIKYSTRRLHKIFKDSRVNFSQNWCSVVIDATVDKIKLIRFSITENDQASKQLNEIYQQAELNLSSIELHEIAVLCGESYLIAYPDLKTKKIKARYHDPRNAVLFYDKDDEEIKRFGAKWFIDENEKRVIVLYYPDRIEYWISRAKAKNLGATASQSKFEMDEEKSGINITGEVPVFHFRRNRRTVQGELDKIMPVQDSLNKLVADMMVTAEFQAYPQRYLISNVKPDGELPFMPGATQRFPAGDGEGQQTQVGQFAAAQLDNYLKVKGDMAETIGAISKTPKHYFFSQGGTPSGEALIAMEAPLNEKVDLYIERFTSTWKKVAQYLLRISKAGEFPLDKIEPIFKPVETVQPLTKAMIRQANTTAGIPISTSLRWEGRTEGEIEQMRQDKADDGIVSNQANQMDVPPEKAAATQQAIVEKAATTLAPVMEEAIRKVGDAAIGHLLKSGTLERVIEVKQKSKALEAAASGKT